MKALIAIDSFKGCISSFEAAEAIASGLGPSVETCIIPVSDGGEGFCNIVTEALGGQMISAVVHDPLGRFITAEYGLCGTTAVIESASASGLSLMREEERDPMRASSFGTGEMIRDAVSKGATDIYIGLGGTGTNDGGIGMLRALEGIDLSDIHFKALCDVSATFCGPNGASAVYGPQKGATPEQVKILDERLYALAGEYLSKSGRDVLTMPGSGAAGGMGGAVWAMLHGELVPGAEAILELLRFEEKLRDADLVITGEGRMDSQTFQGKLPYAVAKRTKMINDQIKVIAFTGRNEIGDESYPFDNIVQVTPTGTPMEVALNREFAAGRLAACASELSF